MRMAEYRYFDDTTRDVDFAGLMADLGQVAAGDVVLLHGCCHNPTGANLTQEQWHEVIALLAARGAVPFVDIAYQGFGDGLDSDAWATRAVASGSGECLIAVSCSKNFGIYRERTGLLMAVGRDKAQTQLAQANLAFLNRQNYSFPPDHGARIVTTILTDRALREEWQAELEEVRLNMLGLRQALAAELARLTNSDRFSFVARHRGMFSRIGASPAQVERMRAEHGIYMVGDSRMNIAGLNAATVPVLARAIVAVGA
jgi:aromatic-amino-acid transaminase